MQLTFVLTCPSILCPSLPGRFVRIQALLYRCRAQRCISSQTPALRCVQRCVGECLCCTRVCPHVHGSADFFFSQMWFVLVDPTGGTMSQNVYNSLARPCTLNLWLPWWGQSGRPETIHGNAHDSSGNCAKQDDDDVVGVCCGWCHGG